MFAIFQCTFFSWLLLRGSDCARSTGNVVYPTLLEARGLDAEKVLYIQDDIVLRLQKTSVLSESFVFSNNINGRRVDRIMNGKELEANMYHDRSRMASVTLEEKAGGVEVKGILSETLRIAPLPLSARSEDGHIPHEILQLEQRHRGRGKFQARSGLQHKETFHAELKIVVDDNHRRVFGSDQDLVVYLATCMKLVNIRYEDTSDPTVQFLLTTVEVAAPEFAEVFFSYDVECASRSTKTYMDPDRMINKTVERYGNSSEDITVFVTSVDLADNFSNIVYNYVLGQAKFRGLCSSGKRVAIVEDTPPLYTLVQIIAHELAHTLGATHDGEDPLKKIYNMTEDNCPSKGYMMSPYAHGNNNGHFSNCSLKQMKEFIGTLDQKCKNVTLEAAKKTTKVLPGTNMNLTKYCHLRHPNFPRISLFQDNDMKQSCRFRCCPDNFYSCFDEIAVDGMPCGHGKICFRNKCDTHGHLSPNRTVNVSMPIAVKSYNISRPRDLTNHPIQHAT
uniref:Putative secreted metalloprotease n=1 Tax=Ixodes ricinus TaxID=34613 RepID=A0A6B0VE30_IXORI